MFMCICWYEIRQSLKLKCAVNTILHFLLSSPTYVVTELMCIKYESYPLTFSLEPGLRV
jgi:hypothetical protein